MALKAKSLILYNFEVTQYNRSIDFRSVSGGPILLASLNIGFYSLTSLLVEVARAMKAADPTRAFTVTVNRTINGGTENRVTIATSGIYLDLLFGTGPRIFTSASSLLGFAAADRTGSTSYTGTLSAGISILTEYVGYTYLGPEFMRSAFGAINISARGDKEAVVWSVQKFFQVEFKWEPEAKVITEWAPFMTWAMQQKPLEFTPEVSSPLTYYECTLEVGNNMQYTITEMLPDFPFNYRTGLLKFRQKT